MESQTPQQILDDRNENQVCHITSLLGMQILSKEILKRELNVISIREPKKQRNADIQSQYDKIDSLHGERCFSVDFQDINYISKSSKMINPNKNQIESILDWAKNKYQENGKMFVVHCFAGISRSSAVAMLINYMINGDLFAPYDVRYHSPNKLILEFGAEILKFDSIPVINKIKAISNAYFAGDEYKYEIF